MKKIPSWVWILAAAGGAFYLYAKYKTKTIALTGATVGNQSTTLPGTSGAINQAGVDISSGLQQLFNL